MFDIKELHRDLTFEKRAISTSVIENAQVIPQSFKSKLIEAWIFVKWLPSTIFWFPVKHFVQRRLKGFADDDIYWDLNIQLAAHMLPRLQAYRKMTVNNNNRYEPPKKYSDERWLEILDTIIWYLDEYILENGKWTKMCDDILLEIKLLKRNDKYLNFPDIKELRDDRLTELNAGLKEIKKDISQGRRYFGNYFEHIL